MELLKREGLSLTEEKALWMYQKMLEIRGFEDKVHELFAQGVLPGFVHLYAGEEAVAVGCALIYMMATALQVRTGDMAIVSPKAVIWTA